MHTLFAVHAYSSVYVFFFFLLLLVWKCCICLHVATYIEKWISAWAHQVVVRQLAFCIILNKRCLWLHLLDYRNMTQCFSSNTFDWFHSVPQGLPCNAGICPQLPFSIFFFLQLLKECCCTKDWCASLYNTKSLLRLTHSHSASVWSYSNTEEVRLQA